MNLIKTACLLLSLALFASAKNENPDLNFGKQVSDSGIRHSFLICGNRTVLINEDNQIVWQTNGYGRDGFVLGEWKYFGFGGKCGQRDFAGWEAGLELSVE